MKQFSAQKAIVLCVAAAVLFANAASTFAQSTGKKQTVVSLLSDDGLKTTISFEAGSMMQKKVMTSIGEAVIIKTDEGTSILKQGYPDLPKLTASIIIPDQKDMEVTVVSSSYTDYENVLVAPSKGSISRTIDPATIPFTYAPVYGENNFWPEKLAELRDPYILRDFRGQTVVVYPYQYNPVTKTLRVYTTITVSVTPKTNGTGINSLVRTKPLEKVANEFGSIYSNQFLNYSNGSRYVPLGEEGNMLIISYGSFIPAMQPFIDWKIQKGIRTEIVDVATIGNDNTAIKNYVTEYYNTKGLAFLLLVGDDAQVSASETDAGDSDNEYAYILGNDHYQEFFVGRFSAENEEDVATQVTRSISYEKTPLVDDYYAKGVGIASDQGPGDDGEWDWEHENNIRTQLVNYNYDEVYELFDGTHAGAANDESGNPNDNDLAALVNEGAGIVNYTGHGGTTSISTTGFSTSDVDAKLTNTEKWPFLWIVGCQVGNFTGSTCFGETWARASYGGQPSGGIASFMSTINQWWNEPMEGQDEMNNILTESETDNIKRTFAGISVNGCFSMNDAYGNTGYEMTDTWTIFGDPSLVVRTALPLDMAVTHDPLIYLGSTQFTVVCDAENATACLTQNGEILGTATVTGGYATLEFAPIGLTDDITLTITGYNKIPYISDIPAQAPSGAYVLGTTYTVVDITGNNNGMADYNESITLDVTLENVGVSSASDVIATLATTDGFVTITDATQSYGTILNNASAMQSNAFALTIADNVPDGHVALFTCTAEDDLGNSWVSNFSITLNAPVLAVQSFTINDMTGGNGDGHLDPGEQAIVTIYNTNNGHSEALGTIGSLATSNPYVTVLSGAATVGTIAVGSNLPSDFTVEVVASAPYGIDVPFTYSMTAGAYLADYNFVTVLSPAIEDFETNTFTQFPWELSGTANWLTSNGAYEGSYCAKSGNVSDNQSSTLEITLDVQFDDDISFMKRVSSEGGYDFLQFYVDGQLQDEWSGEEVWTASSFPVLQGTHTFKWTFKKDGYLSEGSDCGWVDNIVLPAFEVNTGSAVVELGENSSITTYPNPFNTLTSIQYGLNEASKVTVKIYNVEGKEMKTLINNEEQSAGSYQLAFDGSHLPSGTYYCYLTIGNQTTVQKLVLSK